MKQIGPVVKKFYRIQFWCIILAGKFDILHLSDGSRANFLKKNFIE